MRSATGVVVEVGPQAARGPEVGGQPSHAGSAPLLQPGGGGATGRVVLARPDERLDQGGDLRDALGHGRRIDPQLGLSPRGRTHLRDVVPLPGRHRVVRVGEEQVDHGERELRLRPTLL